jgi:hypothetical protein
MLKREDIKDKPIAIYDPERRGIFIHKNQLAGSNFKVGDRFSIKKGQRELFALTLIKDDKGDILFDKTGIFIYRTRRADIFLGGIFDDYVIYFETGKPDTLKIKPLEMALTEKRS